MRALPGDSVIKNLPANAEDTGSILGSRRSAAEGNGNPLQYSYLGNPMDRGAWWATVLRVAKRNNYTTITVVQVYESSHKMRGCKRICYGSAAAAKSLQSCPEDSVRPSGQQPTRLLGP